MAISDFWQYRNIGLMANKERYLDDDIVGLTACSLVIAYGITNVQTLEVSTSLAIPGRTFHFQPITDEYARVQMLTVISGHQNDLLDIVTSERIMNLRQAINKFILSPQ